MLFFSLSLSITSLIFSYISLFWSYFIYVTLFTKCLRVHLAFLIRHMANDAMETNSNIYIHYNIFHHPVDKFYWRNLYVIIYWSVDTWMSWTTSDFTDHNNDGNSQVVFLNSRSVGDIYAEQFHLVLIGFKKKTRLVLVDFWWEKSKLCQHSAWLMC